MTVTRSVLSAYCIGTLFGKHVSKDPSIISEVDFTHVPFTQAALR